MIDEQIVRPGGVAAEALTKALQKLLKDTDSAIRDRLSDEPTLEANLRDRHAAAVRAERTEGSAKGYNAFADEAITQAAVHWLLGCVFVRFLEDNGWLDERNAKVAWIAGPADRLAIAKDRRTLFLRPDPNLTDRDYLLHVFVEVAKLPGVAGLFDHKHNPLYSLQPTAQGAAKIVEFFQKTDPDTNSLIFDFTDPEHGTRFLGDLYQNLSESARKRYALCQTPGFVIDFILDRTLTPALDAFGLETVRMIDPTCGSGHFLLATFARLFRLWQQREPATNPPALAQKSLNAIHGVDLNPFAAEISRFRLLIAALEASGVTRLRDALDFRIQVAAGDSLLHGSRPRDVGGVQTGLYEDRVQFFYETEDSDELKRILSQPYHVVVGNPPYINVSDPVLREAYRDRFSTCSGKYQMGVPFTERFFDLTVHSDDLKRGPAGWMGMIVSNAFMKRTFGKKLIETYLRQKDLTHVIDMTGVYLPGHNTPTTILVGRNRLPVGSTVRAVLGICGETGIPDDPAQQPVWLAILNQLDRPGSQSRWLSVADAPRDWFNNHPWSIGGGGATELKEALDESVERTLGDIAEEVGITSVTGEDDAYVQPTHRDIRRLRIERDRPFVVGELISDWYISDSQAALWLYDEGYRLLPLNTFPNAARHLSLYKSVLGKRRRFGVPMVVRGLKWYEWQELYASKLKVPLSLVFSFVSTNNQFVLDRGGRTFNRSAPVVKLPSIADEQDYLRLLGLLNSSTASFWLRQVCFPKGGNTVGAEGARVRPELWDVYYEYDAAKLKLFPVPAEAPLELTRLIQREAEARSALLPNRICASGTPERARLTAAREEAANRLARMIALQEEIDWQCYQFYGLLKENLTLPPDELPPLALGERAFEIIKARQLARGEFQGKWFARHRSTPRTEVPGHWPEKYRRLVERRIAVIESDRDVGLIEQPEYKRRWNLPIWEDMEKTALKSWLLDCTESDPIWKDHTLVSCAQLRDVLARDANWLSVAEIYHGGRLEDLDKFVIDLATHEAVPFLPVLRYTEIGLRKRAEWEQVWKLQREEDTGAAVKIPVPPKYASKDFQKADYWRLRGGLDVPKERFTLYQGFQRDSDETPVLGWAGWSHLEQARALAAYYQRMRTEEGWGPERLKPVLAGLLDLREWLKQWHDELDPETGLKLGTYFSEFAEAQCQELGFTPQEVLAWQPQAGTTTGRKKKSKSK